MTNFYAQPYDQTATGFYFQSVEEFQQKTIECKNAMGQEVEEFEIQFIDGEALDAEIADECGLYQTDIHQLISIFDAWSDDDKKRLIIAVGECGYDFKKTIDDLANIDIDIYDVGNLRELAEQFVEEGLFGEVPKAFESYIDYEAIGRDLSADYTMTKICGQHLAYRCA